MESDLSGWSIVFPVASWGVYVLLFSFSPVMFAIAVPLLMNVFAMFLSAKAMKNPKSLGDKSTAIIGMILGLIFTLIFAFFILNVLIWSGVGY